jgi:hypothetical protein
MADDEQKVEHINLKVAGQDGSVVQFKIKKVIQINNHPFYIIYSTHPCAS